MSTLQEIDAFLRKKKVDAKTDITLSLLVELIYDFSKENTKIGDEINTFKWSELEKIASPDKWMEMYEVYSEMLTHEDVASWWQEQFNIANTERNELKMKESCILSPDVKVTYSSLPFPTSIEEYETVIANLIEAIPSQTNDRDWWPDNLTDAVNEANKLLENKKSRSD